MIFAGGQASALSCLRPDAVATFLQLEAAPESYMVLHGRLVFDEGAIPRDMSSDAPQNNVLISGAFTGKALTMEGFTSPYQAPVNLEILCFGPWCGSAVSGEDAVFFVKADTDPATAVAQPCGDMIFYNPDQQLLESLTECMRGVACTPAGIE
jgi:hypothetical protein